jgi:transposase
MGMEEFTEEPTALVERVAALGIGTAALAACVRVPHESKPGARRREVRTCAMTTRSLLELRDWLVCQGVTRVVMEATSASWKPPFYLLEDDIAECWVVNARDVKNVPGRPKTGKPGAVWLAKLAERGMVWPSFIPPRPQRQLRDLTRYRRTLTHERTREKQRTGKLLEDAQVKLSSVISDIFGKSGRDMLDALIGGQRNPHALAALARGTMRAKTSVLQEALTGHFTEHHAFLLAMMLSRIDALTAQIDQLTARIEQAIAPFAHQVAQLDEIPGIGAIAAQDLLAETGAGMSRFPTPRPPGVLGQVRAQGPPVRRPEQTRLYRQGQPWPGGPSANPPQPPPAPAPSSHPATGGSSNGAASNAPWPPSATPSSLSPGTCCPTPARVSPTSAPPGTTASLPSGANGSSSPNSNASPA